MDDEEVRSLDLALGGPSTSFSEVPRPRLEVPRPHSRGPSTSLSEVPRPRFGGPATSLSEVPRPRFGGPATSSRHHEEQPYALTRDRVRREIRPPARYGYSDFAYCLAVAEDMDSSDPSSYKDAISSKDAVHWDAAMNEELNSLQHNQTWSLVKPSSDKRVVGCKWIFKRKDDGNSGNVRYKARLVAKGYSQVQGVDFNDVFSPVVKHTSIRILLSLVASKDLELEQLDVKTAFLHGDLEEQIYMSQPEGFEKPGEEDRVCLLKKSLYGLKQSPRQWYKKFDSFIMSVGFHRSSYDSCVYFKKLVDGEFVYLLLYVDDMLIATSNLGEIKRLKEQLSSAFEMKDLGAAKKILGMEITRDRSKRKLYLSQKSFAEIVIRRFGLEKSKVVSTPLAAHFKLSADCSPKSEAEKSYMEKVPYSSAVGSLMYLMVCTRPDIAQAVSVVSRYLSCPGKGHWEAVKWIFRYLKGTIGARLEFGRTHELLTGYVDSDFAGDLDRRRSLTGYVFTFGGCAISWKSTLQSTVALSSTEAEYMAITEAIKEAIWLRAFVGELSSFGGPITVFCDNQSAVHLTRDRMYHERTKHIDIRYHFVRDVISEGKVIVKKIGTEMNSADMLTKPLPVAKFNFCKSSVSVCI